MSALLRQQVSFHFYSVMLELEWKYSDHINALLKQKKGIILKIEEQFGRQIAFIDYFGKSLSISLTDYMKKAENISNDSREEIFRSGKVACFYQIMMIIIIIAKRGKRGQM